MNKLDSIRKEGEVVKDKNLVWKVNRTKMLDKLQEFMLTDPYDYVKELISSQIETNPSVIKVKARPWSFEMKDDGEGYSLNEINTLVSKIFFSEEGELKKYEGLARGIIGALQTKAKTVTIESVKDGEKTKYIIDKDFNIDDSKSTSLRKGTRITVDKKIIFEKEGYRMMKSVEAEKLRKECTWTKTPIIVNKRRLKNYFFSDKKTSFVYEFNEGRVRARVEIPTNIWRKKPVDSIKLYKNGIKYGHTINLTDSNIIIDNPDLNLNLSRNSVTEDEVLRITKELAEKASDEAFVELYKHSKKRIRRGNRRDQINIVQKKVENRLSAIKHDPNQFADDYKNIPNWSILNQLYDKPLIMSANKGLVSLKAIVDQIYDKGYVHVIDEWSVRGFPDTIILSRLKNNNSFNIKKNISPLIKHKHPDFKTREWNEKHPRVPEDYEISISSEQLKEGGHKLGQRVMRNKSDLETLIQRWRIEKMLVKRTSRLKGLDKKEKTKLYLEHLLKLGGLTATIVPLVTSYFAIGKPLIYGFKKTVRLKDVVIDKLSDDHPRIDGFIDKIGEVLGNGFIKTYNFTKKGVIGTVKYSVLGLGAVVMIPIAVPILLIGAPFGLTINKLRNNNLLERMHEYLIKRAEKRAKNSRKTRKRVTNLKRRKSASELQSLLQEASFENKSLMKELEISIYPTIEILEAENAIKSIMKSSIQTKNEVRYKTYSKVITTIGREDDVSDVGIKIFYREDNDQLAKWTNQLENPKNHEMIKLALFTNYINSNANNIRWGTEQPYKSEEVKTDIGRNLYGKGAYFSTTYLGGTYYCTKPFNNIMPISYHLINNQSESMIRTREYRLQGMLDSYQQADNDAFEKKYELINNDDKKILIKAIFSMTENSNDDLDDFLEKQDSELINSVGRTVIGKENYNQDIEITRTNKPINITFAKQ